MYLTNWKGQVNKPVGISQAAAVVECHALVPLLVEVPRRNGGLARPSNLRQEAASTSCEPVNQWTFYDVLVTFLVGKTEWMNLARFLFLGCFVCPFLFYSCLVFGHKQTFNKIRSGVGQCSSISPCKFRLGRAGYTREALKKRCVYSGTFWMVQKQIMMML